MCIRDSTTSIERLLCPMQRMSRFCLPSGGFTDESPLRRLKSGAALWRTKNRGLTPPSPLQRLTAGTLLRRALICPMQRVFRFCLPFKGLTVSPPWRLKTHGWRPLEDENQVLLSSDLTAPPSAGRKLCPVHAEGSPFSPLTSSRGFTVCTSENPIAASRLASYLGRPQSQKVAFGNSR